MLNDIIKQQKIDIIIDTHLHFGKLSSLNVPSGSDDDIVKCLKKYNVSKAVFSHHYALSSVEFGFEKTIEVLNKYKGFLYTYLVFNPNFPKKSIEHIKKYINFEGVVGIKIHPSWHACYPFDEKYKEFWNYANENQLIILTHSWNPNVPNKAQKFSDPFFFTDIAAEYPNVKIILAHAGGRGSYLYKVIDIVKNNKNIYVDFSGDIFEPNLIETYVKKLPDSKKLLFGTDMPWVDIRYSLSKILNSNISIEDKKNILGLNALKLFNL